MLVTGLLMMFLAMSLQQRSVHAADCVDEPWCGFVTEQLCTTSALIGTNCKKMCGTCGKETNCPNIEPIGHGDIRTSSKPPYKVGTVVNFVCDPGFKRVGADRITCLRNGSWSDPVPYCAALSCRRDLKKVEKGRKCRKPCKKDADCKGSLKTCQCDDWCGKSCFNLDAECRPLPSPSNGYVVKKGWKFGQVVSYACNEGFALSGPSSRRCRSDRKWTGKSPICVPFSACGQTGEDRSEVSDGKITRGVNAKEAAWPWQIVLLYSGQYSVKQIHNPRSAFAGGSIINEEWVLSAAHIFTDTFQRNLKQNVWKDTFLIVAGMTKYPKPNLEIPEHIQIFDPETVFVHPDFDRRSFDYDVALARIGSGLKRGPDGVFVADTTSPHGKFTFTRYVRPVCMPCMNGDPLKPVDLLKNFDNKTCDSSETPTMASFVPPRSSVTVTGFGEKNSATGETPSNLQQGVLTMFDNSQCVRTVQDIKRFNINVRFTNRMFCAVGGNESAKIDSCAGDSGGPVVRKMELGLVQHSYWMQIGIVSWGVKCAGKYPGFYTSVPSIMKWVWETLEKSRNIKSLRCEKKVFKNSSHFNVKFCPAEKGVGEKCSVKCVEGYRLTGGIESWMTSCKLQSPDASKAEWDFSNPPACEVAGCFGKELDAFPNGRINCPDISDIKPIGSTCSATCFERYRLTANRTTTCQKDGRWTKLSTCEKITCPKIARIEHGSVFCTDGNYVDSECSFRCQNGRRKLGPDKRVCQRSGKWSETEPVECEKITCPKISRIEHGSVFCTDGNYVDSECSFRCQTGRRKLGPNKTMCQRSGKWSETEPVRCEKITCPKIARIEHGSVFCTDGNDVDSECSFRCQTGRRKLGPDKTKCQRIGKWSETEPVKCEKITCPKITSVDHGVVFCTDGNNVGSRCSFRCQDGRQKLGPDRTNCLWSGKWSDTELVKCEKITCGQIPRVEHGTVFCTDGNNVGSQCLTHCWNGRQKLGPDKTVCQPNGRWSETETVKCVERTCNRPVRIQNAIMTCTDSSYRVGSSCKIVCTENRVVYLKEEYMAGNETSIQCLATQQWSGAPSCVCPECRTGDQCEFETSWEKARKMIKGNGGSSHLTYAGHEMFTSLSSGIKSWKFVWKCRCTDRTTGQSVRCDRVSRYGACEHACAQVIKNMVSKGDYEHPCDSESMDGVGC